MAGGLAKEDGIANVVVIRAQVGHRKVVAMSGPGSVAPGAGMLPGVRREGE
jgi:hypothetical protein